MKKVLVSLITLLLLPMIVFADDEKEPIKVYVFLAPDCPICEQELEYLEGLDTYNKEFVVVEKELYASIHANPAELGEDYYLGVEVANAFKARGFNDASSNGTPFIVISDVYAASSYNASLEGLIHELYEGEGDMDAVSCIENGGGTDCIRAEEKEPINKWAIVAIVGVAVVVFGGIVGITIYNDKKSGTKKNKKNK